MSKRISLLLAPALMLLLAVGAFAAPAGVTQQGVVEISAPEQTPGWIHYIDGADACGSWRSLWLLSPEGFGLAHRFTINFDATILDMRACMYNYPGYAVPGINVQYFIYGDDGSGRPNTADVKWSSAPIDLPENIGWVRPDANVGVAVTAGDYHFAYVGLPSDSSAAYTFVTSDTTCFPYSPGDPEDRGSFSLDAGATWLSNGDPTGWDGSERWFITGHIEFGPGLADQMMIPEYVMGPPGTIVTVPFYGEVAGSGGENLDGVTATFHFDPTCLEMVGCNYYVTGGAYTSFYDVIPTPDKMACVIDSAAGVQTGDAGMIVTFKFAGAPDVPPGTYHMFDVDFLVAPMGAPPCTCSFDSTLGVHDIDFAFNILTPPKSPTYTYKYTDVAVTNLIDGSIWVPCHLMNPVTFDPPSPYSAGCCNHTIMVYGGCSDASHTHTLAVVDSGGLDLEFTQLGFTGDNTYGVLTFTAFNNDNGYSVVVSDTDDDFGAVEYGTLCVTIHDSQGKVHLKGPFAGPCCLGEIIDVFPGSDFWAVIELGCVAGPVGGYNFLLHFDNTVLDLLEVKDCYGPGMEYFYWDEYQVDDGNKLRIVGIANKPNQDDTPAIPKDEGGIIALKFHASAKWDCNYWIPIDWEVDEACFDNTITDALGMHLYTAEFIETYRFVSGIEEDPLRIYERGHDDYDDTYDAWSWDPCQEEYCDEWEYIPGEIGYNGMVVFCEHIYGPYGDVNGDEIRYTIADAVFFMEYLKGNVTPDDFVKDPGYHGNASDINMDGHQWTIADLIYLVNIINGSADPIGGDGFKVVASAAQINVFGNTISADAEIGGIYLTVKGGGEPVLKADMDMETSVVNGERRIIIMSWDSNTAIGDLITIPGSFEITSVEVSDPAGYLMNAKVTSVPREFALAQNYPNPFNPNTNIAFALPNDANVSLTVYNIAGQKVVELVNGQVKAGVHTVTWNASDATSGVYFYKITAGNYTATRKMVLMK